MATGIEWTDETWNPVTGCSRVSPGCDNCYMFAMYPRLRAMGVPGYQDAPDRITLLPKRLGEPLRWKTSKRVFVNSMSDVFHRDVPDDFILAMFETMTAAANRGHIFQVLTKRPGRAVAWWSTHARYFSNVWPEAVWLGTSVESQKYVPRLAVLKRVPAPVRFLSAEPLLEPIDIREWVNNGTLDWVIVGGESGRGARPFDPEWATSIRAQCAPAGVPVFIKQLGSAWARESGATHSKGGDATEWPAALRSREFPQPTSDCAVSSPSVVSGVAAG